MKCPQCGIANLPSSERCIRCNTQFENNQPLVDGRYVIEDEIGQGAMGLVYRARDVRLGRTVALKLISPEHARDSTFIERFRREAGALASIRNDHVVQIYTMGVHEGCDFYAMEYIEGPTLEQIIREHSERSQWVPVYRALTILRMIAMGLHAVHARGIVHRDIKPANVVIEARTGRPVLLDFGLARALEHSQDTRSALAGTPQYMSPEQVDNSRLEGAAFSAAADVYSLACTAFELLTGSPPFFGDGLYAVMRSHLDTPPPLLSSRRPDLAPLDAILARALAKRPSDRWESAAQFAAQLEGVAPLWRAMGPPLSPPLTDQPSSANGEMTVLIVDDDPMFCRVASRAVELAIPEKTLRVWVASSGVRALTVCLTEVPDVVLLDYDMPGPNGIDTLSELRSIPSAGQCLVLVASASVGAVERWRFGVLGVRDFLDKPVEFSALVSAFRRLLLLAEDKTRTDLPQPIVASTPRRLPMDVFTMLLAVGWADGHLDARELNAVIACAELEGLSSDELTTLRTRAVQRVELDEIDTTRMRAAERKYVYAIARYVTLLDGELSALEVAKLRIVGLTLKMSRAEQLVIDDLVDTKLASAGSSHDVSTMLVALRGAALQE
jgi:eukaryotic-like serine/threonine-protein kinase